MNFHEVASVVIKPDVELAPYTSWRVGGRGEYFCQPENTFELEEALNWARQHQVPFTILGGGTNVLVHDRGIDGLVIGLRKLSGLTVHQDDDHVQIVALAGTPKSAVLKEFLKLKLAPALLLAGLPGDVGGGIVMNAGVSEDIYPKEFSQMVQWIEVLDCAAQPLQIRRLAHHQVHWSYRHTSGWQPGVVIRVSLRWPLSPEENIPQLVKQANQTRLKKQPLDLPSCGSVFINPPGDKSAGRLIDECGLKGFQIGGAQVSEKHANFIVNVGGATAQDIANIIEHVQRVVLEQTQIHLQTEVVKLGQW